MPRVPQRHLVRALLACLAALLLGGCRLDAVVEVAVNRDGGGTFSVEFDADRALVTRAAASGVDPLALVAERVRDVPGWSVALDDAGEGGRRLRLAARFEDAERFDALMSEFTAALEAPELRPLEALRLEREGDRVRLRGTAGLLPAPEVAELGHTPETATAALAESVGYRLRLRLPGDVLDTNADRSDGGVLEWQVPAGRAVELYAEGVLPGMRVAPLVAGGLLAGLFAALWLRRRGAA